MLKKKLLIEVISEILLQFSNASLQQSIWNYSILRDTHHTLNVTNPFLESSMTLKTAHFNSAYWKNKKNPQHVLRVLYSRWDLNPYGPYSPLDFKSSVSTNSTTRALEFFLERKTGFEPATPTLARWCSTPELLSHFVHWNSNEFFEFRLQIYYLL